MRVESIRHQHSPTLFSRAFHSSTRNQDEDDRCSCRRLGAGRPHSGQRLQQQLRPSGYWNGTATQRPCPDRPIVAVLCLSDDDDYRHSFVSRWRMDGCLAAPLLLTWALLGLSRPHRPPSTSSAMSTTATRRPPSPALCPPTPRPAPTRRPTGRRASASASRRPSSPSALRRRRRRWQLPCAPRA